MLFLTRGLVFGLACWLAFPQGIRAQDMARLRAEENFRGNPNGELLALLQAGTPLTVLSRADGWLEVIVDGWVWARSLQMDDREGLDLVVELASVGNRDGAGCAIDDEGAAVVDPGLPGQHHCCRMVEREGFEPS